MHKRDLSPGERVKEPPEKLLKTLSSPAKFIGGENPTESDIETFEILPHCKSNEEAAKERLGGACREERNKKNFRSQMDQDNRRRKSEYILKMVKKQQLHQRPPDSLLDLIIKAITSAPEGYVTFSNIYNYIADKFPFYQENSHWWKKCILVTLKRNRKSFIHIPAPKGNRSLQNDIWTIHPLAAARFVNGKNKTDARKESHEDILLNQETIQGSSQDEIVPEKWKAAENPSGTEHTVEKPTNEVTKRLITCDARNKSDVCFVQIERSILIDRFATAYKRRQINNLQEVTERPVTCGALDKSDAVFVKIERSSLIDRLATAYKKRQTNNSQTINSTKAKDNPPKKWRGWRELCSRSEEKRKLVQSIIEETKSVLTDSLDDDIMEVEEIVPYEPEMHKEQEYVTKHSEQTENLISSLLKAVEILDRNKQAREQAEAATTLKQMQEGSGFIGFDHELWSGPWRGWERVTTRRRDQLVALVTRMTGSLDLATVLADCRQAVDSILQELEKHEIDSKAKITKEKRRISCDNEEKCLLEKIQTQIKDLMKCISNRSSEPPFSYTVLTVIAFASSLDTSLPVPDIHRFIEDTFPFYKGNSDGSWKHSIELILQLNNAFVKACQGPCGRKSPDHGGCWRVEAKSAEDILGRALHRENEIQKKNLEYKQSKENKENNNCNRTAVLENREVSVKQNTKTKEKTAKTSVNLNNVNSDGHQKGMRRNSVIVSTFDLEKTAKQVEPEHVDGTELKQVELPNRKKVTFETNVESYIGNALQESCSDSETGLNRSEVSDSNSSNQSVSSHSVTDSSIVTEMIQALAAAVEISDVSSPSVTERMATNTDFEELLISITSGEVPENNIRRNHSMQHSVKDVDHETGSTSVVTSGHRETPATPSTMSEGERTPPETGSTSVVTSDHRETPATPSTTSEGERTPPETTITKTVDNSRNIPFCQMCGKQFSCSFVFDHHSCFRSRYNSFACYICHVAFNNSRSLWDHLNSLHPGAYNHHLVSSLCRSNDPDRNERDRAAAEEVVVESRHKCTACLAVFFSKHKLDSHKEMFHSNIFTIECNFCRPAQLFRNQHKYQHHLVTRHPKNYPLQYICQLCKARFDVEDHLDKHVLMFHCVETESLPAKSQSLPLEGLVVCYMCKSCFECKQSLLSHPCPYKV